jgi:TonB family protein
MTRGMQIGVRARVLALVLLAACNGNNADAESDGSAEAALVEPVLMPDPTPIRYPAALWDQNVEGETEVLVSVSAVGDVDDVSVAQSSGYAAFDSAAVEGSRKLRFSPAKRGGKPVALRVRIPVRFARDSTATVGTPRSHGTPK